MTFPRIVLRVATALTLLVGGLALSPATPAAADTPPVAAACDVHIGTTYKSGSQIVGYGSMQDCGNGQATLIIQKETCWDCWSNLASVTFNGSGYDQYVYYNCTGTGTQTYRTIITGQTIGGGYKTKASNEIRVAC